MIATENKWWPVDGSPDHYVAASAFGCHVEFWCEEHAPDLYDRCGRFHAEQYREHTDQGGYDYRLDNGVVLRVRGDWCCCGFGVREVKEIAP